MIQYMILLSIVQHMINAYFVGDGTAYTLGSVDAGNCNFLYSGYTNASTNYAALNSVQWNNLANCGRCATVQCIDSRCSSSESILVQILDQCPECKYGDLDLSPSVFKTLTGSDPSRYKIQWDFVECPISGSIKYCFNRGSNNYWVAIQPTNFAYGIYDMKINGISSRIMQNAYYYLSTDKWINTSSIDIELTNINGDKISDTISGTAGKCTDGISQFSQTNTQPVFSFDDMDC